MNKKIPFLEEKDLGRYLQSLDSVRFNESDFLACKTQAKLEVFTSLMLGRTIPIGEHQFIDSYGLLHNAFELVDALHLLPESDRACVNHIFPFQLFFRNEYKTLDGLIAKKLGDPNYKLSLWHDLGDTSNVSMVQKRKDIQKKIINGGFMYEDDDLVPIGDREAAYMLRRVRDQFEQGEQGDVFTLYGAKTVDYTSYNGLLEVGIKRICSWNEDDLSSQLDRQELIINSGIVTTELMEPCLLPKALELIESLNALRRGGLKINNRSHIRVGEVVVEKNGKVEKLSCRDFVGNDQKYEGILEIFDSFYNSSLAKASFAHSESISTARNNRTNEYIQAAIALSTMVKNEVTDQAVLEDEVFNPPWMQNLFFTLDKPAVADKMLESIPWTHIWEAFLDTEWRKSVSELNLVLHKWDNLINNPTTAENEYFNITHELDDKYGKHIENICRILSPSGWSFLKDQKTGKMIVQFLPWATGLAAEVAFSLTIGQVSLDPFWEETLPVAFGGAIGRAVKTTIEPVGKWVSKGYIRKTFARFSKSTL